MKDTYSVVGTINGKECILLKDVSFQEAAEHCMKQGEFFEKVSIIQDYEMMYKAENLLIVSDCNMMLKETKDLLVRPKELHEQFIFLGNFICGGPGFYDFMSYLVQVKEQKGKECVFVRGKNEHNLLEYINHTENYVGDLSEVKSMIEDIEEELTFPLFTLKEHFPKFYDILNESLPYYENDHYILVSGSIDLASDRWREDDTEKLFVTEDDFLLGENKTGKTVVFGNRPVQTMNKLGVPRPWINNKENKIGINGDCKGFGKLLALLVHGDSRCFIGIRHHETRRLVYAY